MKKIFSTILALAVAAITFTSCEDVPMPYDQPGNQSGDIIDGTTTVIVPQGDGTLANPFNVAAIQSVGAALAQGQSSAVKYYFTGIVTSFKAGEEPGNSFGNSTFYIGDTSDATSTFYVYRCLGPGNKNFTSSSDLMVGDTVTIYGTITNYNGTIETEQKGAYVYSVKHANGNNNPTTTPDTPAVPGNAIEKTCAEAAAIALAMSENNVASAETYSITGYITSIVGNVSRNQQTFWMADTKDGGQVFEAYWADLPEGVSEFTVGSKVRITGNIMKYNTTPEIKNAKVEILESAGNGGSSDQTPDTPTVGGEGVTISGTTVTLTNSAATAGAETVSLDLSTLGLENAAVATSYSFPDGTTFSFDANGETNGPKYYSATNGFRVYKNNTITFTASKPIASIVFECDSYQGTDYVGNETATVAFNGNTAVYTNVFTGTSGGGVQLRVKKITITYAK